MSGAFEQIWDLARQVPPGTVVTYGPLARLCGNPRWARVVGYAMAACPEDVPWQRVVSRDGACHSDRQRERLRAEGVPFTPAGKVDMAASWLPLKS